MRKHPARFSNTIIQQIDELLVGERVHWGLDPFGGTGRALELTTASRRFVSVEIEPEWAPNLPGSVIGDASKLPFADGTFDAVCTSPAYGNHMADGSKGAGEKDQLHKSSTNKYRALLGRPLHQNNGGRLHWGRGYAEFHQLAWREILRVTRPGWVVVLNIKDHIRHGQMQPVTDWYLQTFLDMGLLLEQHVKIPVTSMGFGRNREKRAAYESLIKLRNPTT